MDASLTSRLLTELLPADVAASVRRHMLHPSSPLQTVARAATARAQGLAAALAPHVAPLADWAAGVVADNQGLAGLAVLLAVVAAVVVVMNWLRRLVMWWTRVVFRLTLWALVAVLVAWVWQRGVMESVRDAVVVGGKVAGYLAVVRDVWVAEYNRYEGQQNMGYRTGGRGRSSGR
ncbi:nuclear pore assembly and biogenesis domain-containing protein [Purpureocillium lavendulum]|uniref:Nuclear pore assembly and biogenesis domain-containing protein n=1 Tax=Purpureocillium lavendulum TaxID=1247861 RepID=A0AB34G3U1_9HYPO|nr:nuclear pore assembly and biogenesis domain-containing protein [Purpureocillium lavendulum]